MPSGAGHDVKQLNALIEVTIDSAQGYRDAADEAKSSRFSSLFRTRAQSRFDVAERLEARVKSLGADPEDSGTALGSARRWFDSLKQEMMGNDADLIATVEAGEDHVKDAYQKVMLDVELSDPVRAAIESEFVQIKVNHDEMRNLKHGVP
jgi:uncharacterized protein (TIGR02284 family)